MNTRRGYIYVIINKLNGKYYFGKSFNVKTRWTTHLRNVKNKVNRRLYDAINHYGKENFQIFTLKEYCAIDKTELTKILNEKETHLIELTDATNPELGYNMAKGGDGGYLGEESIQKMVKKKTGIPLTQEHKGKISKGNKGKNKGKKCPEYQRKYLSSLYEGKTYEEIYGEEMAQIKKENMRKTMKGRKRPSFSNEWKENIGKASKERFKKQRELQFSNIVIIMKEIEKLLKTGVKSNEIPKIYKIDIRALNRVYLEKYGLTLYEYSKTLNNETTNRIN